MNCKKVLFAALLLVIIAKSSFAATYYVKPSGSDASAGTSWGTAWGTIGKVNSSIAGGDTVLFAPGVYRELLVPVSGTANTDDGRTFYIATNGVSDTPTDVRGAAFLAGQVSIWGSDSVSGWVSHSGNIYKAAWTPSGACLVTTSAAAVSQIDGSNEEILWGKTSASLTAAGQSYYDTVNDTLYVWLYGNADPTGDTVDIEASCNAPVNVTGQDYFTLYGFDIRYGAPSVIRQGEPSCDYNSFLHCNLSFAMADGGSNPAVIKSASTKAGGRPDWHSYTTLIGDSLRESANINLTGTQSALLVWYTQEYFLIDSCYFTGNTNLDVISFKGDCYDGSIRHSTIIGGTQGADSYTMWFGAGVHNDSVYGNVFNLLGSSANGKAIQFTTFSSEVEEQVYILNNTFYNAWDASLADGDGDGTDYAPPLVFKYNIVAELANPTPRGYVMFTTAAKANNWTLDSNLYFDSQTDSWSREGLYTTLTSWQNAGSGHDLNSVVTDPGFANPSAGDFSRPNAGTEMNATYGGRTWTKYGAVQGVQEPDTTDPQISGVFVDNVTSNSADIHWTTDEAATSRVEYGETVGYGQVVDLGAVYVTSHLVQLTSLSPDTTYHFRVVSTDAWGNQSASGDFTFTTGAPDVTPPVIFNDAVPSIGSSNATVIWSTDEPATSQVEYGTSVAYGSQTTLDPTLTTNHSVTISGLTPNSGYHVRVKSSDAAANQAVGNDITFTTADLVTTNLGAGVSPLVDGTFPGYAASTLTDGNLDPFGGTSTTWASSDDQGAAHWVEIIFPGGDKNVESVNIYWAWNGFQGRFMTSQQYLVQGWNGSAYITQAVVANSADDSLTITNLGSLTTSRMRIYQPANMGPPTYSGILWLSEIEVMGTDPLVSGGLDSTAPQLGAENAGNLTANSASVTWSTDEPATSQVEYGTTASYGSSTPLDVNLTMSHGVELTGLQASILYHYRVRSIDSVGNEAIGTDHSFTTPAASDPNAPLITAVVSGNVSSSSALITWTTDELATSQIEYGTSISYGGFTSLDPTMVLNHSMTVGFLQASTTYHFRVKSRDAAGNEGMSADSTFTTLVDSTLPVITNVQTSSITVSTVRVSWTTDEPSNSQVEFGSTAAYGSLTAQQPSMVTNHNSTMTNLSPGTSYHFRVRSVDGSGNIALGSDQTVTTAPAPDSIPPNPVQDLSAAPDSASPGGIRLSWTAPGSIDGTGNGENVSSYDIRLLDGTITSSNWDAATQITPPQPLAYGTLQSFIVSGLAEGQVYHFAIKSFDLYGNESDLSNSAMSYAAGIEAPQLVSTVVDSASQSVTTSCLPVSTYFLSVGYEFAFDTSQQMPAPVIEPGLSNGGTIQASRNLSGGRSWYWRCRAVGDDSTRGLWSTVVEFFLPDTANIAPQPPTLFSPADGDSLPKLPVILTVNNGSDANGDILTYEFQLYDPLQSAVVGSVSDLPEGPQTTSWTVVGEFTAQTAFSWRARCSDGKAYSPWMTWANIFLISNSTTAGGSEVTDIIAYPNPVHFDRGETVTFNLPDEPVDLVITTVATGETVRLIENVSDNYVWDGRNANGNRVAIGIYLWSIRGTEHYGKIVVKP